MRLRPRTWITAALVGIAISAVYVAKRGVPFAVKHPVATYGLVTSSPTKLDTLHRCVSRSYPPIPGLVRFESEGEPELRPLPKSWQ